MPSPLRQLRSIFVDSSIGIDLDRGTLSNWVGRACFPLMPVINYMKTQQVDSIGAFVGVVGLTGDNTGCEDDQCVRLLGDVGHDTARLGQTVLRPVSGTCG